MAQSDYYARFHAVYDGDLSQFKKDASDVVEKTKLNNQEFQLWRRTVSDLSKEFGVSSTTIIRGLRDIHSNTESVIQSAGKLETVLGRIGGRIGGAGLGSLSGIPGGGFIGSQLIQGLGLTGGTALAAGGIGLGIFGGVEIIKSIENIAKWAQEQRNLSMEIGVTVSQMQLLSRISETTGVNVENAVRAVSKLRETAVSGGSASIRMRSSLSQLGLGESIAFENPADALNKIMEAGSKITNENERIRIFTELLGDAGRQLSALSGRWDELRSKQNLISDSQMKNLADTEEAIKGAKTAWENLLAAAAKPATFIMKLLTPTPSQPGGYGGVALTGKEKEGDVFSDPTTGSPIRIFRNGRWEPAVFNFPRPRPSGPTAEEQLGLVNADRAARERYGTPQDIYKTKEEALQSEIESFRKGVGTSGLTPEQIGKKEAGFGQRESTLKEELRHGEARIAQLRKLKEIANAPVNDESLDRALRMPQEFPDLTVAEYGPLQNQLMLKGAAQIADKFMKRTEVDARRWEKDSAASAERAARAQLGLLRLSTKEDTEADRIAEKVYSMSVSDIKSTQQVSQSDAAIQIAEMEGTSGYGLTPSAIRRLDLEQAKNRIASNLTVSVSGLQQRADSARFAARNLPADSDARMRLEQEARDAEIDIIAKTRDARAAEIDSINKFNTSIDDAAEKIRNDFAQGFSSIILGAQTGGGRGARSAIGGFIRGQEGTILQNLGRNIWDRIRHPGQHHGGIFDDILHGTILQPKEDKIPIIQKDTEAARLDLDKILAILERQYGPAPASTGTIYIPGVGNIPSPPSIGPVGANSGGSAADILRTLGVGVNPNGSPNLGGMIMNGFPGASSGGMGSQPSISDPISVLLSGGNKGASSSTSNVQAMLGAGVEIGMAAAGTAYGIHSLARGGGKNIASGISSIAGSAALLDPEPISKAVLTGIAVVSGLVTTLFGDPRQERAANINRRMFTQQYQAPPAENISESGNAGFADVDAFGGVRTSHYSPYPIVQDPYLVNPHRIVVPGGVVSTFGGYRGGAGTFTNPTNNPSSVHITIQTMDAKSFMDNAHLIADAVNYHLNQQHGPLVNTLNQTFARR